MYSVAYVNCKEHVSLKQSFQEIQIKCLITLSFISVFFLVYFSFCLFLFPFLSISLSFCLFLSLSISLSCLFFPLVSAPRPMFKQNPLFWNFYIFFLVFIKTNYPQLRLVSFYLSHC